MIHSGSRGLGHQVATDALVQMEAAMDRDKIKTNDRQLACAKINSKVSEDESMLPQTGSLTYLSRTVEGLVNLLPLLLPLLI